MPPLTSVLIPAEEVGRQAVGLLMRKLGGSAVPEATLLIPALTERHSTRRHVPPWRDAIT